jgi:hypothetical protein
MQSLTVYTGIISVVVQTMSHFLTLEEVLSHCSDCVCALFNDENLSLGQADTAIR